MATSVLIVDDEPGIRDTLRGVFEDEGWDVKTAKTGEAALTLVAGEHFACILLDIWLGKGIDGLETLTRLRSDGVETPRSSSRAFARSVSSRRVRAYSALVPNTNRVI